MDVNALESEAEVRKIFTDIKTKMREANTKGIASPLTPTPYDVERVVRDWREQHAG